MTNGNVGPIMRRLSTVHPWRTNGQTGGRQPWQQFGRY